MNGFEKIVQSDCGFSKLPLKFFNGLIWTYLMSLMLNKNSYIKIMHKISLLNFMFKRIIKAIKEKKPL